MPFEIVSSRLVPPSRIILIAGAATPRKTRVWFRGKSGGDDARAKLAILRFYTGNRKR